LNDSSAEKRLSRKEREFQARRTEILNAATRLFARQGYHGTTMSEIAKEAEFSTGSLYNFFENKEELYFTLLKEKIESLEVKVEDIYGEDGDVEERLRNFITRILDYFHDEQDFFRIFAEQRQSFKTSAKGEFSDMVHEKYEKYLGNMVKLMDEGIKQGMFKPMNPVELALIFLGIINTFLFVFVNIEDGQDIRQKSGAILDIFFDGTRLK